MSGDPFFELPHEVTIASAEVRGVIAELEDLLRETARQGGSVPERLDAVIGRMARWIWPLLDDLHEGRA